MKKNGFTLIELIAVIILLAVIGLIVYPIVNNVITDSKEKAYDESVKNIERAASMYLTEYGDYSEAEQILPITKLKEAGLLENKSLVNPKDNKNTLDKDACIVYKWLNNNYDIKYAVKDACILDYVDSSGANKPEVDNGLVPVLYNGTDWVVANVKNKWYDYNNKEWANAIIVKQDKKAEYVANKVVLEDDVLAYYVWIPKYEYKVNGKEEVISVNFKKNTDEVATTDYTMHPAFTFGTTKLNGIWVGKFELTGDITTPTVKPNTTSLRSQTVSSFFTTIQKIGNYGLTNSDSHMMKNTEWGAVAYLKQSKYGLGATDIAINANSSYLTGAGDYKTNKNQSTTGNITGIYDMSGGAWEYVMGNYNSAVSSSGFSTMPNAKYYDLYTTSIGIKGDASNADGTNGWYGDFASFVSAGSPWFIRGGSCSDGTFSGVFYFIYSDGIAYSDYGSRPIISRP